MELNEKEYYKCYPEFKPLKPKKRKRKQPGASPEAETETEVAMREFLSEVYIESHGKPKLSCFLQIRDAQSCYKSLAEWLVYMSKHDKTEHVSA